eukprot:GFKZ01009875.1.p1 GENE.GFKZ01009875.1~~GFKZ01009875.1.p1  ORF type:complete len:839 (+),score=123.35 GFKZ01009875.1:241-2757(+)
MVTASYLANRLRSNSTLKAFQRLSHVKAAPVVADHDEHHLTHLSSQIPASSKTHHQLESQATPDHRLSLSPQVQVTPSLDDVLIVRDKATAADVVDSLISLPKGEVVAWDTETTRIDFSQQSPVGNGRVICATAYAGHPRISNSPSKFFIDCLDDDGGSTAEILQVFKGYFEDERCKKVWHNYAFDRHMLGNHGITVRGFGGDTMHMARLVDSAMKSYSLEALSRDLLQEKHGKANILERFGKKEKLKDGNDGKKLVLPETVNLQCSKETRDEWIEYATNDAQLTHILFQDLKVRLIDMELSRSHGPHTLCGGFRNMYELYETLLIPFGEMLTDMERTGFRVDVDWLRRAAEQAEGDRLDLEDRFRDWAAKHCSDARFMNLNSTSQKQQLFYAPFKTKVDGEEWPREKSFSIHPEEFLPEKYVSEIRKEYAGQANQSPDLDKGDTEAKPNRRKSKKLKKDIVLTGLGLQPPERTATGLPSVSATSLLKLARAQHALSTKQRNLHGMREAIDHLIESSAISTLISTFLNPLQDRPGEDNRIHASLNLNTETGRLSSRRPNLQNQPALDKDRYKIRKAFVPEEGKSLIVADYGQLELRLLAHITNCESMIEAFHAGGDFHSRTAMSMFDEVARAVEKGDCILEAKETLGADSPPLLKDLFSSQRKKAKVLNFSIAYGKTVKGLSEDWNVSTEEARRTLHLWYKDRPEVRIWQDDCVDFLLQHGFVETIMGRRRHLPNISSDSYSKRAHAGRAAINAPLQGSAADLVMAAMVKLHRNKVLRGLGWKTILQVHDEIILEGPDESVDIAMPIVEREMENPIGVPLRVDLTVDAKSVKSWYDAK